MKRAKSIAPISQNFVTKGTLIKDIESLISPTLTEPITFIPNDATMEDILVLFGKFPSKGQARKNGWTGPVPDGFNVWQIGKEQFVTLKMENLN